MSAIAYHGTPLTPNDLLRDVCRDNQGEPLARNFCVSYFRPDQVELVDEIAASYFIDNGAFSAWVQSEKLVEKGKPPIIFDRAYWEAYYEFVEAWLARRCSWFVIPDVINAGTQEQDALIRECPAELLPFGWPVWHTDEPISRLLALIDRFSRVCIGATGDHRVIPSPAFCTRIDEVWDAIILHFGATPDVHMFRSLELLKPQYRWPFKRHDSTNVARNHNRLTKYGPQKIWAMREWMATIEAQAVRRPEIWIPAPKPLVWRGAA